MATAKKAAAKKVASPKAVDETVENQENPISSEKERPSTENTAPDEVAKMAPAAEVDETVINQENPISSETERKSTDTPNAFDAEVAKMAPALPVDDTVTNQENPGAFAPIDRNPDPEVITDSAGIQYDISKPYPELIEEDRDEEKNKLRQEEAVLNAADWREEGEDREYYSIYFVDNGLTTSQVWKKGETLTVPAGSEDDWMKLSAKEQEERYGRVVFEKR